MNNTPVSKTSDKQGLPAQGSVSAPAIALPKGGGAIRGIGEKFAANPVTGTGAMSVPIAVSPGRAGFGPQLALSYDSGAGNGPFGLGWNLGLPYISRKTDKGLPLYRDAEASDVFILSGAEDLVPVIPVGGSAWPPPAPGEVQVDGKDYRIQRFRPRVEGLFALIERWTDTTARDNCFWRTISRENITTWYGRTDDSRISDPDDPSRIFQWLICETRDDKGNVATYDYLREDARDIPTASAHERNRKPAHYTVGRYLHRIRYGNLKPYLPALLANRPWPSPEQVTGQAWMFEVVLDYGQCDPNTPTPGDNLPWPSRQDPFSAYRAGFEIRTYRLCQRVLMFHHFPNEPNVGANCLVRATEFAYRHPIDLGDPTTPGYTVLAAVTQRGFERAPGGTGYTSQQLPPVEFAYTEPQVDDTLRSLDPAQLANLPVGTQGSGYQWLDLDGEGLSGVLSEQGGNWFYKANLGKGRFGPVTPVAQRPAMAAQAFGRQQFLDLAGDGEIDLVDFSGPAAGFHERDREAGWKNFVPFQRLPTIDWTDPNLRFLDLTGDGLADVLVTEHEIFTWYASQGEAGFEAARQTRTPLDEEEGPRIVFADGTQTMFLADMSGDGLTDLVRIRNGQVCYWPNVGYARFGAKVTLDDAPIFDHPDLFDPRRIRLADIDGSGPMDLIYLGRQGARLYFNRSGNSLSRALTVPLPVATHNLASVQVADLLGIGTACLVWNSHLPADARNPVRYIDLMSGRKPHLLVEVKNNLGAITAIEYTPSTHFYIQDKLAGTPWITRLPFAVHCVSKVTIRDLWRGTTFSATYSYHHGYFDGLEREFRGFGRVEQVDVEAYGLFAADNGASPFITTDHTLYQPPVKTITWFHTGAALERGRIRSAFGHEYFPQHFADRLPDPVSDPNAFHEKQLPEPDLSQSSLTTDEWREALRACKGMVLRQEIYELDVRELTLGRQTPVKLFSAASHNCHILRLQPREANKHAVFLVTESEVITYHYELDLRGARLTPDPRIAHTLNLRHDELGNFQQTIAIGYGRQVPWQSTTLPKPELIRAVQAEVHMAYTETRYTNDCIQHEINGDSATPLKHHRLRRPCAVRTYELKKINKSDPIYYRLEDLRPYDLSDYYPVPPGLTPIALQPKAYHEWADGSVAQQRMVEHVRTLYFQDEDGIAQPIQPHAFGQLGPRGLKYEEYKLALTDALLTVVLGNKLSAADSGPLTAQAMLDTPRISGYISGTRIDAHLTGQYWLRSGSAGFASDANQHFYLTERYTDPFDNSSENTFDVRDLFISATQDALHNTSRVEKFDYRVLAPLEMVDAGGNHTEVAFDTLGRVVALAVKGKNLSTDPTSAVWEGDDLEGYDSSRRNPAQSDVQAFCTSATLDNVTARNWLHRATSRFVYHFGEARAANGAVIAWGACPAGACAILREIHAAQPNGMDSSLPLQVSLECSDGLGNVLMKKVQAEPETQGGALRWIINGLTVLNNKGKPVKRYEPAFCDRFGCQLPEANGVTPLIYYDAAGRLIRTELPDGTVSRIVFSPWLVQAYDPNDTVLESRWYAQRSPGSAAVAEDKRAAALAAVHADTPSLTLLDSLGREVMAVTHNRIEDVNGEYLSGGTHYRNEYYLTFTRLDAEGKPLWIRDARGHLVMQYILPAKANNDPSDAMPGTAAPCYDITGNLLFEHGMDAGGRWMLMDAAGKPMLAWDLNETRQGTTTIREERFYSTDYDPLHRPTALWLAINGAARLMVERYEYQDAQPNDAHNLNGQLIRHYEPSGRTETIRRDFKGNVREVRRTLNNAPQQSVIDWRMSPENHLETDINGSLVTYTRISEFDALNRMTRLYNWHRPTANRMAIYEPHYNARGALLSEDLVMRATSYDPATGTRTTAIQEIQYNAKGQKSYVRLGNGALTRYAYDPDTFRLVQQRTTRPNQDPVFPGTHANLANANVLQQLHYTYDPSGNVAEIYDEAFKPIFFANVRVEPRSRFEYDALYRLISSTGRENSTHPGAPGQFDGEESIDFPELGGNALREYTQYYQYDCVGNIAQMRHRVTSAMGGWTRDYAYAFDDPAQPAGNRLWQTWEGGDRTQAITYNYDTHGNMLNLSRVAPGQHLQWDARDMIQHIDLVGGGMAFYQYDAAKQRTRKSIQRQVTDTNGNTSWVNAWERIYLGGFERFRRRNGSGQVVEEIESHHLFEGEQRLLLVDDVITTNKTHANGQAYRIGPIYRYQYNNHLGSASLELDHQAQIISYEEYHPYGTSAYRALNNATEAPPKRYRYTGMERDEESGLSYHAARYYAPWLGRWSSCDPAGLVDDLNVFAFAHANPIGFIDPTGQQAEKVDAGMSSEERVQIVKQLKEIGYADKQIDEYMNATVTCQGVEQYCKKNFMEGKVIDAKIKEAKKQFEKFSEPVKINMNHWLGNTGSELIIPSDVFSKHVKVKAALKGRWRDAFISGVRDRLEDGRIDPLAPATDLEMSYMSYIEAYSNSPKDDLGFSFGGFQLRATVKVVVKKAGVNTYHVDFMEWKNQAFDLYNWDPEKVAAPVALAKKFMGLPSDKEMCCVENAGKAKAFLNRTEPWITTDKAVLKGFDVKVDLPEPAPAKVEKK